MDKEIQYVEKQFLDAGYPKWLIKKKIEDTISIMGNYKKKGTQPDKSERWLVLHLAYAGEKAQKVYNGLFKLIPDTTCRITIAWTSVKLYALLPKFHPKGTVESKDCNLKSIYLKSDVIYQFTCGECGQIYVGETQRRLSVRINEHQKSKKSAIHDHLKTCSG